METNETKYRIVMKLDGPSQEFFFPKHVEGYSCIEEAREVLCEELRSIHFFKNELLVLSLGCGFLLFEDENDLDYHPNFNEYFEFQDSDSENGERGFIVPKDWKIEEEWDEFFYKFRNLSVYACKDENDDHFNEYDITGKGRARIVKWTSRIEEL